MNPSRQLGSFKETPNLSPPILLSVSPFHIWTTAIRSMKWLLKILSFVFVKLTRSSVLVDVDQNLFFVLSDRRPALAKEMLQSNSRPVIVATVFHSGFEGV